MQIVPFWANIFEDKLIGLIHESKDGTGKDKAKGKIKIKV